MSPDISFVLFADVKGYSRLEARQLERFHRTTLPALANRLAEYQWDFCNTWGDALLICSKEARSIANQALVMRDYFRTYDWQAIELPPLDVRVSLHVGEVFTGNDPFTRGGLIVGQTVITAARVEPIVFAGQVWVTKSVALHIRDSDRRSERFGLDEIGTLTLPKGYGDIEALVLRRTDEPALTPEKRALILSENELRTQRASSDSYSDRNVFSVAIGVVLSNGRVALVRRREGEEGLTWMFPSGSVLPLQKPENAVWREVKEETGLSCRLIRKIGERIHPRTKVPCAYFLLEPVDASPLINADPLENDDVQWVAAANVGDYIGDDLFGPVRVLLQESANPSGG